MTKKKRRFNRVPLKIKVEIMVNGRSLIAEGIKNLSIGGCLLPINVCLKPGDLCHINISLDGETDNHQLNVTGKIVRCDRNNTAIQFTDIDADSFFHLQNIIRYNTQEMKTKGNEIFDHDYFRNRSVFLTKPLK